jgi:hypothetical protein
MSIWGKIIPTREHPEQRLFLECFVKSQEASVAGSGQVWRRDEGHEGHRRQRSLYTLAFTLSEMQNCYRVLS